MGENRALRTLELTGKMARAVATRYCQLLFHRVTACAVAIYKIKLSRPVSRVLSWVTIHLRTTSPLLFSDLPGDSADHTNVSLFSLAPGGVYHAVMCYH